MSEFEERPATALLCVADASQKNVWVALTTDGKSHKEPDWAFVK
jgi:hypothetical protein